MPDSPADSRAARAVPVIAFLIAVALLAVAIGAAVVDHEKGREALDRALTAEAREQTAKLDDYFRRAQALTLVTANNPAYRAFYEERGSRTQKIEAAGPNLEEAQLGLAYLEDLFPGTIGEACFIDRGGAENARAVRGAIEPTSGLSQDETKASFFEPTFALDNGEVYQAKPYLSPDTGEWVVSNSAPVPVRFEEPPAIIHFEITVESFRAEAAQTSNRFDIAIVEANSGKVIADSRVRQEAGENSRLGTGERRFASFFSTAGRAFGHGTAEVEGRPSAFRRLRPQEHNANRWVVVASARTPASSWLSELGIAELSMLTLALLLLGFAVVGFRSSQSRLHSAAFSDPLTGLGNRRALVAEMESRLAQARADRPLLLALFDLDGFKSYNDTFGHPAGDALLVRLSAALETRLEGRGRAYRMGGDEFCLLAAVTPGGESAILDDAAAALSESGEAFSIGASQGSVLLPTEADDPGEALRIADARMYAAKNSSRASAGRQTTDVLVRVLAERYPDLGEHLDDVTALCEELADTLGLPEEERVPLVQAASLHDVGKAAVPDAILSKPGPLTDEEWAFMRQHTLIGERVLAAAPALAVAAKLVRYSHERWDAGGYPEGLRGEEIPLGARVIAVCDAFDAMTAVRPYRPTPMSLEGAVNELRRCAGAQFDPRVVEAFCRTLAERRGVRVGPPA